MVALVADEATGKTRPLRKGDKFHPDTQSPDQVAESLRKHETAVSSRKAAGKKAKKAKKAAGKKSKKTRIRKGDELQGRAQTPKQIAESLRKHDAAVSGKKATGKGPAPRAEPRKPGDAKGALGDITAHRRRMVKLEGFIMNTKADLKKLMDEHRDVTAKVFGDIDNAEQGLLF